MEVVSLCDRDEALLDAAGAEHPGAARTTRWEDLLTSDIDAVALVDDFDAHAPLAIAFLDAGIHVLSETAACVTEEQGRALIAAADRSRATYSFAENYVALPHVRVMADALAAGEIGPVQLIEADYLHAMSPAAVDSLIRDRTTWRGRISPAAYCTHTRSSSWCASPRELSRSPGTDSSRVSRRATGAGCRRAAPRDSSSPRGRRETVLGMCG
jgi:predicted dehydrogenase